MKQTLIDLFTSKKFLAALTAVIVYLAGRFGFDVDTPTLDRIFAAFLVYVGAQGIADHGKSAATIAAAAGDMAPIGASAPRPPAGAFPAVLVALLLLAGAGSLTACATLKADATAIAAGVVTCAKGDVPAAKALGLQLGTEALADVLAGRTEAQIWTHVSADAEAATKVQGLAVASCGFGGLVAELDQLLHPAPAGVATQGLATNAAVDPLAGGRAALAAFAARHRIRIDP